MKQKHKLLIKHKILFFSIFIVFLLVSPNRLLSQEIEPDKNYIENELIIWLKPNITPDQILDKSISFKLIPKRQLSKRLNIWLYEYESHTKTSTRKNDIEFIRGLSEVKTAQNNHKVILRQLIPNDSYYSLQWAPGNIRLPDAWEDYTTGGTTSQGDEIVIAIIDAGFDLDHNDLDLNFWKNTSEIPNNGIDDDNNGYIDDYDGWNAYSHNGNIPTDNHGTHVTGIAGAIGNNSRGICGVNWDIGIMPIAGSSTSEATVVEAYSYAHEMRARYNESNGTEGAFVVATNSSFGVDYGDPDDYPVWCGMYNSLGEEGMLSPGATANWHWYIDEVGDVPTCCPSEFLIGVSNTNSSNNLYYNAGYGPINIDLGAPGVSIYSTINGNQYSYLTGTSMATPHVTGVIALMYAAASSNFIQAYHNSPANVTLALKHCLYEGAIMFSSLNGLVGYGRFGCIRKLECTN